MSSINYKRIVTVREYLDNLEKHPEWYTSMKLSEMTDYIRDYISDLEEERLRASNRVMLKDQFINELNDKIDNLNEKNNSLLEEWYDAMDKKGELELKLYEYEQKDENKKFKEKVISENRENIKKLYMELEGGRINEE